MPFKGSSQINPNALKNDYSGFERAAAIKAQTMAGLGQAIGDGYKAHKQKIADKEEAERAKKLVGVYLKQSGANVDEETLSGILRGTNMKAGEINQIGETLMGLDKIQKQEAEKIAKREAAMMAVKNMPSLANLTPEAKAALAQANPEAITQILAGGANQSQITQSSLTVNEASNKAAIAREKLAEENRQKARGVEFERTKELADIANGRRVNAVENSQKWEKAMTELGVKADISMAELKSKIAMGDYTAKQKADFDHLIRVEDATAKRAQASVDKSLKEALALNRERKQLEEDNLTNSEAYTEVKAKIDIHKKRTGITIDDTSINSKQDIMNNRDSLTVPKSVLAEVPQMDPVHWALYQVSLQGLDPTNDSKIIRDFHEKYPEFTNQKSKIRRLWDMLQGNQDNSLDAATKEVQLKKTREFDEITNEWLF